MDQATPVTAKDSFISQGGDSFQALRLVQTLEQLLDTALPDLLDTILHHSFDQVCDGIRHHMQRDRLTPQSSQHVQPLAFTTQLHASGSDRVNSHTTNPHEAHLFTTVISPSDPEKLMDERREGSVTDASVNSSSVIQDVASQWNREQMESTGIQESINHSDSASRTLSPKHSEGDLDHNESERTRPKHDRRSNLENAANVTLKETTRTQHVNEAIPLPSDITKASETSTEKLQDAQPGVSQKRKFDAVDMTNPTEIQPVEKVTKFATSVPCHSCQIEKKEHCETHMFYRREYRVSVGRGSRFLCNQCAGHDDILPWPCSHLKAVPGCLLDSVKPDISPCPCSHLKAEPECLLDSGKTDILPCPGSHLKAEPGCLLNSVKTDILPCPCSLLKAEPGYLLDSVKPGESLDMEEMWRVDTGKCVDASPTVLCTR